MVRARRGGARFRILALVLLTLNSTTTGRVYLNIEQPLDFDLDNATLGN